MNFQVKGIPMMVFSEILASLHISYITAKSSIQTFPGFSCPQNSNFSAHSTD